jgi:response regulator RpfG family c-di-GMP phosphodiesterase
MIHKILCVDDEPNILDAYRRALKKDFLIETAVGGVLALEMIAASGPYAVIVSDMKMPGMDGVQFLARVKELAPESVRIMLTGNADQQTATEAVNEGNIFRFLTKPCPPESLAKSLTAGIEQYRLIRAEKDLLETTLSGSIQVLTDVLSLVNPTAFGRASRVRRLVRQLSTLLRVENAWQIEIAAMLSQIGCITVPEDTLTKVYEGKSLLAEELSMLQAHPRVGRDLISRIPRLEPVAEIIAHQEMKFSDVESPHDSTLGTPVPAAARILKLALDFDKLIEAKLSRSEAYSEIERRGDWYQPSVVEALRKIVDGSQTLYDTVYIKVSEMTLEMILAADVMSVKGEVLVANGQDVTLSLRMRLENFLARGDIEEPIKVLVPRDATGFGNDVSPFPSGTVALKDGTTTWSDQPVAAG